MHLPALSDLNIHQLHHAYVAVAGKSSARTVSHWATNSISNSSVLEMPHQTFGIDDAHSLSKLVQYSTGNESRVFVIIASSITREAQNALLKLLEEPVAGVHFFILVPAFDILLPTILSRTQRISITSDASESDFDAQEFMDATPTDRIATIEAMLKKTEDGDESKSAITRAVLDSIEQLMVDNPKYKSVKTIAAIQFVRKYQNLQGASHKMLLEYLALNI